MIINFCSDLVIHKQISESIRELIQVLKSRIHLEKSVRDLNIEPARTNQKNKYWKVSRRVKSGRALNNLWSSLLWRRSFYWVFYCSWVLNESSKSHECCNKFWEYVVCSVLKCIRNLLFIRVILISKTVSDLHSHPLKVFQIIQKECQKRLSSTG